MKKLIITLIALMLLAALAVSAMAETMYVNKNRAKVYTERSKDSEVVCPLPEGGHVEAQKKKGDWTFISFLDRRGVGRSGWIQSKYLDAKPSHKHSWGDWKVTRKATCEHSGTKERACKTCGKTQSKEIEKLKHDWSKWKVTKEATCVKQGERTRTCKNCGKKEAKTYFEDHSYGSWSLTREPTCTEKGERARTCRVCGKAEKQSLDKLPHEYELRVIQETTDHSAGVRAKICVNCGHDGGEETFDPAGTLRRGDRSEAVYAMQQLLVEQGYLNAGGADGIFGGGSEKALMQYQKDRGLEADGVAWPQTLDDLQHDFGPWVTVKEMTRTEAGERVRTCRGCGFEQHETVQPGEVFEIKRRGEDIRAMQQMLTELGYDAGGYDGIYGHKLDDAMARFAEAKGMTVEAGVIRPGDVDAVLNAWLDTLSGDGWMGEGNETTPVNLALTVNATDVADDSGSVGYTWSLTNLGSEKVTYLALLLTFGEEPDFKRDNLVINLDGYELKSSAGNSVSGAFNADMDWGEGDLHFAALAVSEADGSKWLSNDVAFENTVNAANRTIAPVESAIGVNRLADGVYPVSFDRGDVFGGATGVFMNAVHIYTRDVYAAYDVDALKEGDTIIVEGEEVPVLTISREDGVTINEDQDARAFYLAASGDGYVVQGFNDLGTYTDRGLTTLTLDAGATFTDAWDIENAPVTVSGADIVSAMQTSLNEYFVPYNTTVRIEAGKVVEINREYVP